MRNRAATSYLAAATTALMLFMLNTSTPLAEGAGEKWRVLNRQVKELYGASEYDKALAVAIKALAFAEENAGASSLDAATSLNNLASVYVKQEEYAQAERLLMRALAIREKVLGPKHGNVNVVLNNLASVYLKQGEYARAERLYTRLLAIKSEILGPDHSGVANALNKLGALYENLGKHAQARLIAGYRPTAQRRTRVRAMRHCGKPPRRWTGCSLPIRRACPVRCSGELPQRASSKVS